MVVETVKELKQIEPLDDSKILILGAFGMLGRDLQKVFPRAVTRGHEADVTDRSKMRALIRNERPSLVINAAGLTDVDYCETHSDIAFEVNGEAQEHLSKECRHIGATLVYFSTDYVFDGEKEGYIESDAPGPINKYGASKLLGEKIIMENSDDYRIIRTSWLFGEHGKNFVSFILEQKSRGTTVRIVSDRFGKPTYSLDLAYKTAEIVGMEQGIYHATNDGICTWYDLARIIYENILPIPGIEDKRPAKRPKFSVLINTKISPMRHWKEALNDCLMKKEVHE